MKVFVSYSHVDDPDNPDADDITVGRFVERLKRDLGERRVFWDKDIPRGEIWPDVLARESTAADVLLVFESSSSLGSKFVRREVYLADSKGVRIIPVALEAIDTEQQSRSGLDLILDELQHLKAYELGFDDTCVRIVNDIRQLDPKATGECPVIAVMGTKGGPGKSTFIAAAAELVASTGATVMVIDADIEASGLTKYLSRRAKRRPRIHSMLDATWAKQKDETLVTESGEDALWDVTPPYLRQDKFGEIYLIPGRMPGDLRESYESVADIGSDRPAVTLQLLKDAIARRRMLPEDPACVLIDSGAENNPLVSAGFVLARYGFIVSSPNLEFIGEIGRLERMHRKRFPDTDICSMNVIVNRAEPETRKLWAGNASFIPEDKELRTTSAMGGTFDFEGIGLNDYYLAVRGILESNFGSTDQHLVPDEAEVWVRPRIEEMNRRRIPEKLLSQWPLRFGHIICLLASVAALTIAAVCAYLNYRSIERPLRAGTFECVLLECNDEQLAATTLNEIRDGASLADIGLRDEHDPSRLHRAVVAPGEAIPGVGRAPELDACLKRAQFVSVCSDIYTIGGRIYVAQVKDHETRSVYSGMLQSGRALAIVMCVIIVALASWQFARIFRRRRLLAEVARRSGDREFIERLLRGDPEKRALRWLKDTLNRELATAKRSFP